MNRAAVPATVERFAPKPWDYDGKCQVNNNGNNHLNSGHARGHGSHGQSNTVTLTSGTTTISDQSATGTDYIFAGTASSSEPTLQFIGNVDATYSYGIGSVTVDGHSSPSYGALNLGFRSQVEVARGITVNNGDLSIDQNSPGSVLTLDGNTTIDNGGTIADASGGVRTGDGVTLNGDITVGSKGANKLSLQVSYLQGNGTIRETGAADSVSVGTVTNGINFDVQKGTLAIGGVAAKFDGTIGPANGVAGPALGRDATVTYDTDGLDFSKITSASFDTSTGLLSFPAAAGGVATLHFAGDARGLNLSVVNGVGVVITDHPGTTSPIPITFT